MSISSIIGAITGLGSVQPSTPSLSSASGGQSTFANALQSAISQVDGAQQRANTLASNLLATGQGDVHTVALASQQAELSMEMFQQVRNKFVSAYQEIMKMPM